MLHRMLLDIYLTVREGHELDHKKRWLLQELIVRITEYKWKFEHPDEQRNASPAHSTG